MNEAMLEAFFRKRIRLIGGYSIKLAPTERGVPDRLVMMPDGRMFLVELKTDKGSLSAIQIAWHNKLAKQNVRVHVLYGQQGIIRWIGRMVESGIARTSSRKRTPAANR